MNLYEAIFVRKSVRNYCFDTLPPQTLDKIWEHYKEMPALFSGIGVDMAILDNRKGQERMLSMFSVKAPYYMAFYSEESERYLMNVGYIMEQMVLYLCSIGLGTCFIGSPLSVFCSMCCSAAACGCRQKKNGVSAIPF